MWINNLNLNFKDSFIPLSFSCISVFHKIKVNEPLMCVSIKFWIPTQHFFQFNGVELCPSLDKFDAIMGEHDFGAIILPTLKEDLSKLALNS